MKVNKFWSITGGIAAVGLTLLITSGAFSAPPQQVVRDDGSSPVKSIHDPVVTLAGPTAFYPSYLTGFEAADGYFIAPVTDCVTAPNYGANLLGQPGNADPSLNWGSVSPGSCATIISGTNPFGGAGQHLRMSYDPTRASGPNFDSARLDARIQANAQASVPGPQAGVWTIEFDQAMTGQASDIRLISQDRAGPLPRMWQMVFSSITGEVYYSKGGLTADPQFTPTGVAYDQGGVYHHWKIVNDACTGFNAGVGSTTKTDYYYDGLLVGSHTGESGNLALFAPGCVADQMTQLIILTNNFNGSLFDMDNVSINYVGCPHTCGNGILEPTEGCEPGVVDCNAGHTCFGAGETDECTCSRICTLNDPCILVNGDNGDFTPPFDALYGAIFLYFPGALESVAIDTCGTDGYETGILFWGSAGDGVCDVSGVDCGAGCPPGETCLYDPGNANDDCCDPTAFSFCSGSDSTAPCYDPGDDLLTAYSACTCYDIPPEYLNIFLAQIRPAGAGVHVNINKKNVCEGGAVGSCCDSNNRDGDGVGCEDNVLLADCSGAYDTWSGALKCADIVCECVPDCDGRNCGPDGCGGICAPDDCDDSNPCTDDSCPDDGVCLNANNTLPCDEGNFCIVGDTCTDGACVGTPRVCSNNNVCDGVETCDEANDLCTNPDDLVCDDGLFCNGAEGCDSITGCFDNADPCDPETQTCYEDKDDCFDHIIPTVSEWGLVILTLLLLTGAKVYFSRRQAIA